MVANLSLDDHCAEGHRLGKCMVRSAFASVEVDQTQGGLRKCIRPLASRSLLATRP